MKRAVHPLARHLPLIVTAAIFVVLFGVASKLYDGFFSTRVFVSLFTDNVPLAITAVGMTLVIFSGGIDLSVGAVMGFAAIFTATLIEKAHFAPALVWLLALLAGTGLGGGMGVLIHYYRLPPFLITLAGMFLARGTGFWISTEPISIGHDWYVRISGWEVPLGAATLQTNAFILLAVLLGGYALAHQTRFGRNLLAIGGNEQSALLMGLPVGRTKVLVYALNGFCAALAGVVSTLETNSGDPSKGTGLELDAIAIVVIGGTLLVGGRGHILGTLIGLLIFGTIQAAINFDGRLNSWWMLIVVGALLLVFILLQRIFLRRK